jgi:hypothetical protein
MFLVFSSQSALLSLQFSVFSSQFCLRSPVAYAPELQRRGTAIAYGVGTQTGLRAPSYETTFYVDFVKRTFSLRQTGLFNLPLLSRNWLVSRLATQCLAL